MISLMRLVNNLSLKYKLAVLVVPGMLVIMVFSAWRVIETYAQVKEMAAIEQRTALALNVNALVHELQKERGTSSGYVASKGLKFGQEIDAQRKLTDKELADFNKKLEFIHFKELEKPINASKELLGKLEATRKEVGALTLSLPENVAFYSKLINQLIAVIGAMPLSINNTEISTSFMGLLIAQNFKEPMGIERALLSGAFAANKFAPGMHRKLLEMVQSQNTYQKLYFTTMSEENIKPFQKFLENDIVKKTDELREIALRNDVAGNFGIDPTVWFKLQTDKINLFNNTVIIEKLAKDIHGLTDKKMKEANLAWVATASMSAAIVIIGLAITIYLSMIMLRSIRRTTGVIGEIVQGDFTRKVHVEGNDEIGKLGVAVNVHVQNMGGLLEGMNNLTSKVNTSASEIVAAVNEQASISSEQSASLTEITATMEEFSASSSEIADSANTVAKLTKNMLEETDRSAMSLGSLKEKMDEIEADNKNSISEIVELDRKSREIGKIMGIIDNIADQTKMIAFNAAIEAAGAGETGKRFGVVAGEIRRLADNVMESTSEIQSKIDEIQRAVNRLVIVSEKGAKTVREGTDCATATLDDLMHIVAGTKSSADAAMQIAFSTQQQKTASNQVLGALKEIDQGLHQSSSAIRQTSSHAVTMGEMANNLQNMLGKFKIKNGNV